MQGGAYNMDKMPEQEPKQERDIEKINKALANYGLYSAEADVYPVQEHPEDERWL